MCCVWVRCMFCLLMWVPLCDQYIPFRFALWSVAACQNRVYAPSFLTLLASSLYCCTLTALRASALDFASGPHTAYLNIINTNRSFYYAHLTPSSTHTTYLTGTTLRVSGFDGKTTKNTDINNVLEAAGFEAGTYEILWVDGQSFYLNFAKSELVEVSVLWCIVLLLSMLYTAYLFLLLLIFLLPPTSFSQQYCRAPSPRQRRRNPPPTLTP